MKKALLVLLLLAVAGGLFAQVTWTGNVFAGLRATSAERGPNWALGWYNSSLGAANQVRLNASYRNEAGTYGGNLSLRAQTSLAGGAGAVVPFVHTYRGWFTMFDGKLKILGGKWSEGEFTEGVWGWGLTYWSYTRPGVAAYFYPMDGLRFGFGVNASAAGTVETDLRYWLGAAYEGDSFGAYFSGAYHKDDINFAVTAYYDSDPILVVGGFDFMRLDDFANAGEIDLYLVFGFYGVENLDIELENDWSIYGADNGEDDFGTSVSLDFTYHLDVGGIKLAGLGLSWDITGESFSFKPYVRFGLGASARYIQLDYEGSADFAASTYTNAIGLSFTWSF
jgi:hypothetical protein